MSVRWSAVDGLECSHRECIDATCDDHWSSRLSVVALGWDKDWEEEDEDDQEHRAASPQWVLIYEYYADGNGGFLMALSGDGMRYYR